MNPKHIVLSRKGFDSSAGGYPSPILGNRELYSIPIPENAPNLKNQIAYKDLTLPFGKTYDQMLFELTGVKFNNCHLDPDIYRDIYPRKGSRPGWGPIFGPGKGSYTHLKDHNVGPGDIILFFGWFRHAELINGKFSYMKRTDYYPTDMQIIYGFMKIEKDLSVIKDKIPDYAKYHPHVLYPESGDHIYLGSSGGFFNLSDELILTKKGQPRSRWNLPFLENTEMSNNPTDRKKRWNEKEKYFQTVGRGQEFVLEATPEVTHWVRNIVGFRKANEYVDKNTIKSTLNHKTGKFEPTYYEAKVKEMPKNSKMWRTY